MRTHRLQIWLAALGLCAGCSEDPPVPGGYQPSGEAEVLVDAQGVPHIYAQSDSDAFYASGYVTARYRLFQLDLVRRRARGQGAEVLGAQALRDDLASRTMNFPRLGAADRERLQRERPELVRLFDAWVSGVNAFITKTRRGEAPLPVFFGKDGLSYEPAYFTLEDPFIIGKMLSFGMSNLLDFELLATLLYRLSPRAAGDIPLSMPVRPAFTMVGLTDQPQQLGDGPAPRREEQRPADPVPADLRAAARFERLFPELGSNNWAVAGKHTADGRSLLAGDPHQPLNNPLRFFAQHLNSAERGGSLDAVGFGFVGAPGIQLGHNRRVAWTATTNYADVMDLWDVAKIEGGAAISLGGQRRALAPREETILVRSEGGQAKEARTYTLYDVPEVGVLLPDELLPTAKALFARGEVLFAWTGFAATSEAASYAGMARAGSLEEWDAAARLLEVGAVNLVAADAQHIRYRVHARVPDRGDPQKRPLPYRVMDGADARTVWSGAFLPADKLPAAEDPERGFLATANNEPWGFTRNGRPDQAPYYYGYFYDPGDRAFRIEGQLRALVARGKVTAEDMLTLQRDAYSQVAEDLVGELAMAMTALGSDPKLTPYRSRPELFTLLGRLSTWDRQMRRDSPEAVLFYGFAHFAAKRALEEPIGTPFYSVFNAEPSYIFKILRLALKERFPTGNLLKDGKNVVLVGGLADAADWLKARFGGLEPERYRYRDLHGVPFLHPLGGRWNPEVVAVDGGVGTVNVSSSALFDSGGKLRERVTAASGSIYRMVVGFDEGGRPRAQVNFPRGNDENPDSPHYNDQTAAWVEGKSAPLAFSRDEAAAGATERFTVR